MTGFIKKWVRAGTVLAFTLLVVGPCLAGAKRYTLHDGLLQSFDDSGQLRWRALVPEAKRFTVLSDGVRLDTGLEFDTAGHSRHAGTNRRPTGVSSQAVAINSALGSGGWESPVKLFANSSSTSDAAGPTLLPDGSACVLWESSLKVTCSLGSQAWGAEESLTAYRRDNLQYVERGQIVSDHEGNLVVLYFGRETLGNGLSEGQIHAIRKNVNGAWSPSQKIYGGDNALIQNIQAVADHHDNIIVLIDPYVGAVSIAYSAEQHVWLKPEQVELRSLQIAGVRNLAANRSGSVVAAAYVKGNGRNHGVYAGIFDSTKLKWGPVRRIPGTDRATFVVDEADARLPLCVDQQGNVSLLAQFQSEDRNPEGQYYYGVWGLRMERGQWLPPFVLSDHLISEDIARDGDIVATDDGGAIGSDGFRTVDSDAFRVYRYLGSQQWITEDPIASADQGFFIARTHVMLLGDSGGAVAVDSNGYYTIFDGLSWGPGQKTDFISNLVANGIRQPDGSALLVQSPTAVGITGTWLRP